MVKFNNTFDSSTVEPREDFEPLPAGNYNVQIVESEMKPTKAGDGQYLQLTLEVIDGPHTARKLWDRLNLINPNQTAVEIATRTLSAISRACGVQMVSDSEQLHYKPMSVRVKLKPARGEYEATNEIGGYKPAEGGSALSQASGGGNDGAPF